jgi:VanZ family protein
MPSLPSADPPLRPAAVVGQHASPLARLAVFLMAALIVYASLYPFTGWTDTGVPAFAYLTAPLPRYWLGGEIFANVFVYAPFGALVVWAFYPVIRGWQAFGLASLIGALMSAGIEALQTFLPTRIASNVDLAANFGGTVLGALIGVITAHALIDASTLVQWRVRWFSRDARTALLLAGLWVVLQIPRQPMLFGTGDIAMFLTDWFPPAAELLRSMWTPSLSQRMLAEHLCTGAAVTAVGLLITHRARPVNPRGLLVWVLVVAALACKAMLQPLANAGLSPFAWVTAGAVSGLLLGGAAATLLAYTPRHWQRAIAVLAVIVQLLIVNLVPAEEYFDASRSVGRTGWLHLESLIFGLSVMWPLFALGILTRPLRSAPASS